MDNANTEERIMSEIGTNISRLRKEKRLTQEALAERLHVSPQAVSKWENGLACPDIALLPKLAAVFGVSVDFLLGITPPASASAPAAAQPAAPRSEPAPSEAEAPPTEAPAGAKAAEIHIFIDQPDKKTVHVRVPSNLVKFGLSLGSTVGGLGTAEMNAVQNALAGGLTGEILRVDGDKGETVRIVIE